MRRDRCRPVTIRTAVHPSIWTGRFDAESLRPALERAAAIGFDHVVVPLRRFEDIDPAAIARVFQAQGLTPLNTAGVSPETDIGSPDPATRGRGISRLTTAVGLARDMGSTQVNGVLYGPLGKASTPASGDTLRRSAEALASIDRVASEAGVRLAIEIVNRYETNLVNTVEQGLSFIALSGADLRLHLDTFHMSIEEADPTEALRRALPKLGYFELDQSHRGRLDQGSLDLTSLLHKLRSLHYDGVVGIEAFSASKMAPDHAAALAIWRDTFADGDRLARDGMKLIREVLLPNRAPQQG